jgi:hypothetical protein
MLGPSFCTECKILHKYTPNENPQRQGTWTCPFNEYHEESHLLLVSESERSEILNNTKFFNFLLNPQ